MLIVAGELLKRVWAYIKAHSYNPLLPSGFCSDAVDELQPETFLGKSEATRCAYWD